MSFDAPHVPTDQETAIYDALSAGDQATVDQMRADAYAADQMPPSGESLWSGWVSPTEQFSLDYRYALDHYHDDNEAPESEREQNTADATDLHNQMADQQAAS
jgi:hypothetical protein